MYFIIALAGLIFGDKIGLMLTITGFFSAILAIFYLVLTANVIRNRLKKKSPLIFWDDASLTSATRAHGNFSEYCPIFLILFLLWELNSSSALWLYITGCVFVLGRFLHAYSILFHEPRTNKTTVRVAGMLLTLIPILKISVIMIIKFFA